MELQQLLHLAFSGAFLGCLLGFVLFDLPKIIYENLEVDELE